MMTNDIKDRLDAIFAQRGENQNSDKLKQEVADRLKASEFESRIASETKLMHRWDELRETRINILQTINEDKRSGIVTSSVMNSNHPPFFRSEEFKFVRIGSHEGISYEVVLQADGGIQLYTDGIAGVETDIDAFGKQQTDYILGEFAKFVGGEARPRS